MKKIAFLFIILSGIFLNIHAQRTNVFAAFQLIENGKYAEAKKAVEEALEDQKTKDWYRTWYAQGLLCHKAYQAGIKADDKKKYELYPDQLFLAYESFEKSLTYKRNSRITDQLEPIYVELANNLMALGKKEYQGKRFDQALKAYENALKINESYITSVVLDSNLVYNTALAAYNSKEYERSTKYLNRLNEMSYSPNVPHLLHAVYLAAGDTANAELILSEGIERYQKNEELVLVFVDLLFKSDKCDEAVAVLDSASVRSPEKYIYPYTKGLVYQKKEMYEQAIEAYQKAVEVDPEKLSSYTSIGTCYFNMGVEKEQNARSINNNSIYREELAKSVEARKNAVSWLEKALDKSPDNQAVRDQLLQLYRSLHMTDKIKELQP